MNVVLLGTRGNTERDPTTGYNGACILCGLRGHESKVCPKTVAEVTLEEAPRSQYLG